MGRFHRFGGAELLTTPVPPVGWVWEGMLAEQNVTLFTSLWKTGKSTLLALLLARRRSGDALLGRLVQPGASAIVTEEPVEMWMRRARNLDFGPDVSFYCRPFTTTPTPEQWLELIDELAQEHKEHGVNLVAIDPLIHVLPCSENNALAVREAMEPLRRLTNLGMAVLLMHHPAKREAGAAKASRGNGALPAFADILLEWRLPLGDPSTRRRWLHGFSRFEETPRQLLAELHINGTEYRVISDQDVSDDFSANWDTIAAVLSATAAPLTRQELLHRWPAARSAPHVATVWRWLGRAVELGLVVRTGKGTKLDPCRYQLRMEEDQRAG